MKLKYTFEVMTEVDLSGDYYDRVEPPTADMLVEVDYTYNVDISVEDLAEYLLLDCRNEDVKHTLTKVLHIFGGLLEEDEDFIEFLTQKYEVAAKERCEEEYD